MTIGAERPPYGARHRKFWPLSGHFSIRPFSSETPSRCGPRISGQSPSATRLDAATWADASIPSGTSSVTSTQIRFSM